MLGIICSLIDLIDMKSHDMQFDDMQSHLLAAHRTVRNSNAQKADLTHDGDNELSPTPMAIP